MQQVLIILNPYRECKGLGLLFSFTDEKQKEGQKKPQDLEN
jgi:hypothetical protein